MTPPNKTVNELALIQYCNYCKSINNLNAIRNIIDIALSAQQSQHEKELGKIRCLKDEYGKRLTELSFELEEVRKLHEAKLEEIREFIWQNFTLKFDNLIKSKMKVNE